MEGLGINWKILIGQIINFVILLFLLKKFAYKPFFNTLQKRREKIEDGMKKAEEAKTSLSKIRALGEEIKSAGEKKAKEIVMAAKETAEKRRQEILSEAEKEKEKIITAAKETAKKEIKDQKQKQREEALDLSFLLAEKFLKEKFDREKDKKFMEEILSDIK